MWIAIVLIVLVVVLALYLVALYNGLVQKRNRVGNAWAQIEVQLEAAARSDPEHRRDGEGVRGA